MKKNRLFVSLLAAGLIGVAPAMAQTQVVKLTTGLAAGQPVTLMVNQTSDGVTVDWGDGTAVAYPKTQGELCEIKGEAKGSVIVVTGGKRFSTLVCSGNGLTAIDASGAENLRSLYCQNNELATLNIKGCKLLTDLNAANNKLTRVSITETNFPNLENLNLANNELTTTTGSGSSFVLRQENLQHANVSGNKLKSIYVTKNPSLDVLKCADNAFSSKLQLTANAELSVLMAAGNNITGITEPNGGFGELRQVFIEGNEIAGEFDLDAAENLDVLSCAGNEISSLNLPGRKLNWMNISNNKLGFNSLPNASYKPEQFIYAPQGQVDITEKLKKSSKGGYYIDLCPSYGDRMNSEYVLDLGEWAVDANGGKSVTFTMYAIAADGSKSELKRITGTSTQENDYFAIKPNSTPGMFTFHTPQREVLVEMTSLGYPDLVVSGVTFAVGEENLAAGIGGVEAESEALRISGANGVLRMAADSEQGVTVYTLSGRKVWSGVVGNAEVSVNLQQGVYVVNGRKVVL